HQLPAVRVLPGTVRGQSLREGLGGRSVVLREGADGVVTPLPGHPGGVGQRGLLPEVRGQCAAGPFAGLSGPGLLCRAGLRRGPVCGIRRRGRPAPALGLAPARDGPSCARPPPRGHGRPATSSASPIVNACAYRALPTIAPSTPCGTSSRSARRSSREEIPPEATTFASVRAHTS